MCTARRKKVDKAMNAQEILDGWYWVQYQHKTNSLEWYIRSFLRWLRDYHTSVTVAARLTSQQEGTTNNLIVKGELAVHPSIHSPLTHSFIVNWPAG
jgi:hypothetical protein